MKRMMLGWGMCALLVSASSIAIEDPNELVKSCMGSVKRECEKWAASGGGSGNPKGLTAEIAVELAMGERYMMYGTVVIFRNQAMLEVDFKEHPWLRTRRRAATPYYRIDTASLDRWKKLNRKYVSFAAVAQGAIFVDSEGKRGFDILLQPTSEPLVDTLRR
jgi:hypothetical protein